MKTRFFISIFGMVMILSACTDTFLIGRYENNFFLGNTSDAMYEMLCPSGELNKVLLTANLNQEKKDAMYTYNCQERSGDKIRKLYASMTAEEKYDLQNAFRKNGFAVNVMAVYDSECATSGRM